MYGDERDIAVISELSILTMVRSGTLALLALLEGSNSCWKDLRDFGDINGRSWRLPQVLDIIICLSKGFQRLFVTLPTRIELHVD